MEIQEPELQDTLRLLPVLMSEAAPSFHPQGSLDDPSIPGEPRDSQLNPAS